LKHSQDGRDTFRTAQHLAIASILSLLLGLGLQFSLLKTMSAFIKKFLFSPLYRKLRYYSAFVLYSAIVIFGAIPGVRAEAGELASGFVLHSLAYSTIAYLLFTGAKRQDLAAAMSAFLWVVVLGAADEFIQSFFPYRNGRVQDWIVDMGAALVTLSILLRTWPALRKLA
jgi:VanZ family protein